MTSLLLSILAGLTLLLPCLSHMVAMSCLDCEIKLTLPSFPELLFIRLHHHSRVNSRTLFLLRCLHHLCFLTQILSWQDLSLISCGGLSCFLDHSLSKILATLRVFLLKLVPHQHVSPEADSHLDHTNPSGPRLLRASLFWVFSSGALTHVQCGVWSRDHLEFRTAFPVCFKNSS